MNFFYSLLHVRDFTNTWFYPPGHSTVSSICLLQIRKMRFRKITYSNEVIIWWTIILGSLLSSFTRSSSSLNVGVSMAQSLDVFSIYTHSLVISSSLMTANTINMQRKYISNPDFFPKKRGQLHLFQTYISNCLPATCHQLLDFC